MLKCQTEKCLITPQTLLAASTYQWLLVLKFAGILKTTKQGLLLVEQSIKSPQDSIVNKATTSLVGEEESNTSARLKTPKQPGTERPCRLPVSCCCCWCSWKRRGRGCHVWGPARVPINCCYRDAQWSSSHVIRVRLASRRVRLSFPSVSDCGEDLRDRWVLTLILDSRIWIMQQLSVVSIFL